jgi:hypothetical protein
LLYPLLGELLLVPRVDEPPHVEVVEQVRPLWAEELLLLPYDDVVQLAAATLVRPVKVETADVGLPVLPLVAKWRAGAEARIGLAG